MMMYTARDRNLIWTMQVIMIMKSDPDQKGSSRSKKKHNHNSWSAFFFACVQRKMYVTVASWQDHDMIKIFGEKKNYCHRGR